MPEQKDKVRLRGPLSFFLLSLFLALSAMFLRKWFAARPELAERYASGPYRVIMGFLSRISGLFSVSLSELLLIPLIVLGLFLLIRFLRRIVRDPQRYRILLRGFLLAGGVFALAYTWFVAFHALHYERQPLGVSLQLDVEARETEELERLTIWLMNEAALARSLLPQDAGGTASSTLTTNALLAEAAGAFDRLGLLYPQFLHLPAVQIKPICFSRWLSYTGITGMYNPFLAEANVNVDQPSFAIPFSVLHETAHVAGYAREDEANFLAFLSGIYHPLPEYRYAALHTTLSYVTSRLYSADRDRFLDCLVYLDAGVAADINAERAYWQGFQGPVRQAAASVNDAFLKGQRQTDGVRSYGRMIDLVLAFYDKHGDIQVGLQPPVIEMQVP